jgi:hypothetical protein
MKRFARIKTLDEIKAQCQAQGVRLCTRLYDTQGWDTVVVGGPISNAAKTGPGHAIYSTFNGKFFGRTPDGIEFDSTETRHEHAPWFQALLSFFYVEQATN